MLAYSRNAYDHALRNIGIEFVTVETPEQMRAAIGPRTAIVYLVTGHHSDPGQPPSLEVLPRLRVHTAFPFWQMRRQKT